MSKLYSLVNSAQVSNKTATAYSSTDVSSLVCYVKNCLPESNHPLSEAAAHHFFKPGKLLRAKIAIRASNYLNIEQVAALPWAAAIEILHNASLIHDDICDGDALRRGRPSVWHKYGPDTALMLGDWLIALAFELAAEAAQISATPVLVKILADQMKLTTVGEVGGLGIKQMINWHDYVDLSANKTAPLLAAPLQGIMAMAQQNDSSAPIVAYFRRLGSAYQIANDILNFEGTDGAETQGSDLARRSPNGVTVIYRQMLSTPEQMRFDSWYRTSCNSLLEDWRDKIIASEALNTTTRKMHEVFCDCEQLAEELPAELYEIISPLHIMVKQVCEKSISSFMLNRDD